jgi:hypothetical protein
MVRLSRANPFTIYPKYCLRQNLLLIYPSLRMTVVRKDAYAGSPMRMKAYDEFQGLEGGRIKKELSSAKVKVLATPTAKSDDESKEESHLESNLQSFKQLVAEEQTAPKETEQIQGIPVEEEHPIPSVTITSEHDYIDDYILNVLHDLPEQWIGKEMKLHVIADRRDATWIIKRVFQDVERGLITGNL